MVADHRARAERSPFLGDELSAGSLGRGDDLVEARIAAQIVPAWIQEEIAVCRHFGISWDRRNFFELLERAVGLACPRVNQRQIGNPVWTVERVLGNRLELDRALCLTDRFFFSAKASVKYRNLREVRKILGFVALFGFHFLARGCKRGLRLLLIAARTRNQSVSPILRVKIESLIRPLRRSR